MPVERPFSEFTYAFAVTHEITHLAPWWTSHVPIIPSLQSEKYGGYDIRFDLPGTLLLIQFKRTKHRVQLHLSAAERAQATAADARTACKGGFDQFWTTADQHRVLERVSAKFPYAYYIAPRFQLIGDLHHHFSARSIMANSVIVRLGAFPTGTPYRHRVLAPSSSEDRFVFSQARRAKQANVQDELGEVWRSWRPHQSLAEVVREAWKALPQGQKTDAASFAREEVRRFGDRKRIQALLASPAHPAERNSVDTERRPPWPSGYFSNLHEKFAPEPADGFWRLLALSYLLDVNDIQLSLLQPRQEALS